MRDDIETPRPEDLTATPELAVVALLAGALRITRWALLCRPQRMCGQTARVQRILRLTPQLDRELQKYSQAIPHTPIPSDPEDLPF
jgi:hypothetical protein